MSRLDRAGLDLADAHAATGRAVRSVQPDVIVNAAAYTAVDKAETRARTSRSRSTRARPGVLAEEAKRIGALLVHYSTDYVFDGEKAAPYVEGDPTRPISVYGETKLAGEQAIQASGCRHLILRTSWVYGPRGKNFLLTMLRLAKRATELRVVDDQVGAPDLEPRDRARDRRNCCEKGAEGLYHMTARRRDDLVRVRARDPAARRAGDPVVAIRTDDYPTPARRPANSRLDCSRAA